MKSFDELHAELLTRVAENAADSQSVAMVKSGVHAIGKKVVEEAAEAWMAAEHESPERAAEEISQLLYWTQLLMIAADVSIEDVYRKL